jgi:hypothetical protein
MRKRLWLPIAFFATVLTGVQSFGEIAAPSLKWGGFASLREGQVVKGEPETVVGKDPKSSHVWIQELKAGLSLELKFPNIPATGNVGFEMATANDNSFYEGDFGSSRRLTYNLVISQADVLFKLHDGEKLKLDLDLGYFPYKYNSSVRNLGEYLFRTGTYPQYIINEIDFPMARLLGLKLGATLWKTLNVDIIVNANTEWAAIGDLNLSGLLTWKPHPVFELGLGGSWCSFISTDLDNTTPLVKGSEYLAVKPGTSDTAVYNYTFAGQKLMGRLTFDLKRIFPETDKLGDEDLKLYTEAAILGLINYPVSRDGYTRYDTLWQRIPVMLGFNFPMFKLIDVLSFEFEYFGNPYPNNTNAVKYENQPTPLSSYGNEKNSAYMNLHNDDVKWSVYARKTFASNLYIMAQAANDHIRWTRNAWSSNDGKEALRQKDDWYFTFKFGYQF